MARVNKVKTTKGQKISESRKQNKILNTMSVEEILEKENYGNVVGKNMTFNKGGYVVNTNGYSILEELIYN